MISGVTHRKSIPEMKRTFLGAIRKNAAYAAKEKASIVQALEFSARAYGSLIHRSGVPFIAHCLSLAEQLLRNQVDSSVIILAFLHDLPENTPVTLEEIEREFGSIMRGLVEALQQVGLLRKESEKLQQEDLNRILSAMSKDIRIAIIRMMHRLYDMQNINSLNDELEKIHLATETIDLYVPFAGRLGMNALKIELENLCFRVISPDLYSEINGHLQRMKEEDIDCLDHVRTRIVEMLEREKIESKVEGRIKSVYSIYRKMTKRKIPFDQVYDKLAIRIIVREVPACYQVLGLIHTQYSPIPGTFDDYIATPKANNYQSLHTAIFPIKGVSFKPVEIQIRTFLMDQEAEFGAAAHWQYKQGDFLKTPSEEYKNWIKNLIQLRNRLESYTDFIEVLKKTVFGENTMILDHLGKVIYLPSKATAGDYIRYLHLTTSDARLYARINGRETSDRSQILENGDRVEICERGDNGVKRLLGR
jgi:GTP diphosphokinase / guanosine-3',5'-bis(diphosphate) 3'-diphosphatase